MTNKADTATDAKSIFVGIGASAGGLEAFVEFLKGLPEDHGMVIALVQHLDPNHDSLMPELVAAKTKSPVHSVTDNLAVEPGHIYLIPPGYDMEVKDDHLMLKAFDSPRRLRRPIDRFFRSLAVEYGDRAVGVVLSGTGSDGAEGAREIKGAGGLVFVQDPKEAKYDGMPQSVLDQGGADVTCGAREVADIVRDYFNLRGSAHSEFSDDDQFLSRIMRHVRFRTGHDFSDYKQATMLRRVAVRMSVLNLSERGDYLRYIAEHKEEADRLFRDLLINVTSFFRDAEHFDQVNRTAITDIVENTEDGGEIRVWVPGCSTGEEAYSMAILLSEEVSRLHRRCSIIIFGTDIDEEALGKARIGHYSDAIADSLPAGYLDRYFQPRSNGFTVGPQLRDMVRFSRHSFVKDPPFSKLNMVSCRNVLIYFKESLQETAIRVFHYALNEGGYLFIGPSENPKTITSYFTEVSARARIYRRRPGNAGALNLGGRHDAPQQKPYAPPPPAAGAATDIEKVLLKRHAPAHLHIDAAGDVMYASENVTDYLRIRPGKLSNAATAMIAPELETLLRRVLRVEQNAGSTEEREYQGKVNGREVRLVMTAERMADGSVLLVLKDQLDLRSDRLGQGDAADDAYIQELESELDEARQAVRTTVEELETSNEELKSSNEEMMSMNEELQSANEELTTINDELQEKLRELNQLNADLKNFTASARIATVFLDDQLRLKNFTVEAQQYFAFTQSDIGRKIADLNSSLDQDRLIDLCQQTLEDRIERSEEFAVEEQGCDLSVEIMPYSPDGKSERGVVFTLQDVTELREAVEEAERQRRLAEERMVEVEQIYRTSPMAMGLIDREMRYIRLNEKLAEMNGEPIERHIGARIKDVIPAVAEQTADLVGRVFESGEPIKGQRVTGTIKSRPDDPRVWESDWMPHIVEGEVVAVAVNVRDITDEVETAESLRRVMRELEHRVKNMLSNVSALINQARREVQADREIYEKLTRRIEGLAKTHALLTAEQWSSALLRDVIAPETIGVYGEEAVTLSGPAIRVNSQTTLALGMAIHEMATNAAKYGAFSRQGGHVTISWSRINDAESDRLQIEWKESGGPKVEKPAGNGFGSQLIRSTLEGTLDGEVSMRWEPEGLHFVVSLDFSEVTAPNDTQLPI
jgi:two-component system CheB/CheR fusion protein